MRLVWCFPTVPIELIVILNFKRVFSDDVCSHAARRWQPCACEHVNSICGGFRGPSIDASQATLSHFLRTAGAALLTHETAQCVNWSVSSLQQPLVVRYRCLECACDSTARTTATTSQQRQTNKQTSKHGKRARVLGENDTQINSIPRRMFCLPQPSRRLLLRWHSRPAPPQSPESEFCFPAS